MLLYVVTLKYIILFLSLTHLSLFTCKQSLKPKTKYYQQLEGGFNAGLMYSAFALSPPFTVFNHVYRRSLVRPVMSKNKGWAIWRLMLFLLKRNGKRFPSVWLSCNCESNSGIDPFTSGTFTKFLGQPCGAHWFSLFILKLFRCLFILKICVILFQLK